MAGSWRAVARRARVGAARAAAVGALIVLGLPVAEAGGWPARRSLVDVSVEVEGTRVPLFRARDGSGRYYLEAHAGRAYALHVANRTGERLAVLLSVDGLNVISGERETGPSAGRPGRMYVLDPWGEVRVRGWRTSLDEVRRFTFVDEGRSYAARTGRANARMGWIQAWAYRERRAARVWPRPEPWERRSAPGESGDGAHREGPEDESAAAPEAAPPAARPAPEAEARGGDMKSRDRVQSYPGTGWGSRAWDPATLVDFHPEAMPSDTVTLRYEYARALHALGVLPEPRSPHRLWERERGDGFARPPD